LACLAKTEVYIPQPFRNRNAFLIGILVMLSKKKNFKKVCDF